jgi:predicted ferric reductase
MSIKIFTTIRWIVLWAVIVIAIVTVEVFWIARPAVPRGDLVTIENYLLQKLSQPGKPKLGSAALILIQNGEVVATHPFGIANAEKKLPSRSIGRSIRWHP